MFSGSLQQTQRFTWVILRYGSEYGQTKVLQWWPIQNKQHLALLDNDFMPTLVISIVPLRVWLCKTCFRSWKPSLITDKARVYTFQIQTRDALYSLQKNRQGLPKKMTCSSKPYFSFCEKQSHEFIFAFSSFYCFISVGVVNCMLTEMIPCIPMSLCNSWRHLLTMWTTPSQ